MSLCHALKKRIKNTAPYPVIRICMDTYFPCDLIRRFKSHAGNIICHLIRIFLHNPVNAIPVILIDLCRKRSGNSIFLQIDHRLSHVLLFLYLLCNFSCFSLTDPFYLCQPFRLFFNNAKGIFLKFSHDPSRQSCTQPFDGSGSQITLNGNEIFHFADFRSFYLQLHAVQGMHHIFSCQLQKLSFSDVRKCSHTCQISVLIIQIEYRISIILIPEDNVLHVSFYLLHISSFIFLSPGLHQMEKKPPEMPSAGNLTLFSGSLS